MKIKIKRISSVEIELDVFLAESEINSIKSSLESEWQKESAIAGYRKGKAPLSLVFKKYSREIKQDLQDRIVSAFYKKLSRSQNWIQYLRLLF
ncbi:MAG: trigger factor family protein [Candidatus Omnitrophica bacterium]|nr:trigger factor family protein [Candidatus Omnitrophota bacterium]